MIKITISADSCDYIFDDKKYTVEEAKQQAEEWFTERKFNVTAEHLTMCQYNGCCPYPNRKCSDCG